MASLRRLRFSASSKAAFPSSELVKAIHSALLSSSGFSSSAKMIMLCLLLVFGDFSIADLEAVNVHFPLLHFKYGETPLLIRQRGYCYHINYIRRYFMSEKKKSSRGANGVGSIRKKTVYSTITTVTKAICFHFTVFPGSLLPAMRSSGCPLMPSCSMACCWTA